MIVIADTGPLNYLVLLGLEELLPEFYGQIVAPSAVIAELQHPRAPAIVKAWAHNPPDWLKVIPMLELDGTLHADLGLGEREAISLAMKENANVLLMDDHAARSAAEERGLSVTGTLAILRDAARAKRIDLGANLARLKAFRFRASDSLLQSLLRDE